MTHILNPVDFELALARENSNSELATVPVVYSSTIRYIPGYSDLRVFVRISEVSADVLGSRSGLVRVRSRDSKDDIQSAAHRQIWLRGWCGGDGRPEFLRRFPVVGPWVAVLLPRATGHTVTHTRCTQKLK